MFPVFAVLKEEEGKRKKKSSATNNWERRCPFFFLLPPPFSSPPSFSPSASCIFSLALRSSFRLLAPLSLRLANEHNAIMTERYEPFPRELRTSSLSDVKTPAAAGGAGEELGAPRSRRCSSLDQAETARRSSRSSAATSDDWDGAGSDDSVHIRSSPEGPSSEAMRVLQANKKKKKKKKKVKKKEKRKIEKEREKNKKTATTGFWPSP